MGSSMAQVCLGSWLPFCAISTPLRNICSLSRDKDGRPLAPYLYFDEGPWVGTAGFSDRAAGLVGPVRLSFPDFGHRHSRVRLFSLPHQEQNLWVGYGS